MPYSHRGPRNHDLLVVGDRIVIGIEAKVNETLDKTIEQERKDASKDKQNRINWLLETFLTKSDTETINSLRYQLFTGLAGTMLEAKRRKMEKCMFLILSFYDQKGRINQENLNDIHLFCDYVGVNERNYITKEIKEPNDSKSTQIGCYIIHKEVQIMQSYIY